MQKKLHLPFLAFGFWLLTLTGFAQTFPVTISTQITQPSPIYLSNYADPTTINSPIKIQLILNDLTITNREVRLKCYLQGNGTSLVTNDFVVGAQPLYLEGGFPLQLTNVDLAPYFQFQNLQGINPNQYAQALPEGIYTFSVEVYDVATSKKLSKKSNVTTIIFQNEPPLLNLPLNNASIMQQNIQNIIFSWTPRQINVSNVEYQFDLVEIWDAYTPVQNAFAYSPPIYSATTRTTTLLYGISEPQLIPGKKYAWRIKAKALAGAEELGVFKNNGYSEIFAFTYEVFCTAPLQITTTSTSQDQAKISWSGSIDNYDYQVNYREKNASSDWYNVVTARELITLANLKPNTTYEYTIGSACAIGKYTHSTIHELTTLTRDEIAFAGCGIKPDPNDLKNKTPLPALLPGDVVAAGDFPIVVLHTSGSNGTFSGDGYVTLPFLAKFKELIDAADKYSGKNEKGESNSNIGQYTRIRITFNNIGVNTDFKLISGEIIASYDPNWNSMADLDGVFNDAFGDTGNIVNQSYDFEIATVVKNEDGTITVTSTTGVISKLDKTPNDIIITDKEGKQFTVAANAPAGNIETSGKVAPGGIPNSKNTNGMGSGGSVAEISSEDVNVIFSKGDGMYSFDTPPTTENGKLNKTYTKIPQKDGSVYNVNFKAISNSPNDTDVIIATATFKNGKTKKDLVFKTQNGTYIDSTKIVWNGNTATITLKKTLDFVKENIIATVRPTASKDPKEPAGKYDIAGTIAMWHLTNKKVNVTLVSINGATIPADAEKELNAIYEAAGVTFEVNTISEDLENTWGTTIKNGDSDILNTYTDVQQSITQALQKKLGSNYKKDTYYMLFTNEKADNNYDGFMPLKRQFGFVFDGTIRTLAHELGHGVFGLQHPFVKFNTTTPTDLLMDYGKGTLLSHNDWEIMHAPGIQLYPFTQGSSDGAKIADKRNFLMPNHKPFRFKDADINPSNVNIYGEDSFIVTTNENLTKYPNSNGALFSFKSSGKEYVYDPDPTKGEYLQVGSNPKIYYKNSYNEKIHSDDLFLLLVKKNECFFYLVPQKLSKQEYEIPNLDISNYERVAKYTQCTNEILCTERLEIIANYMSSAKVGVPISYESLAITDKDGELNIINGDINNRENFKYKKITGVDNSIIEIRSFYNVTQNNSNKTYLIITNDKNLIAHGITSFWLYMGANNVPASGDLKVSISLEQFEKDEIDPKNLSALKYCTLDDKTLHRGQEVGDVSNFFLAVIAAPIAGAVIIEGGAAVSLEVLTETLISYYSKEAAVKCLTGAAVDLALQYGINHILKEEGEELEDISKANLALSCVTNTFINDKNVVLGSAIYGFGNNIITQLNDKKSIKEINISDAEIAALTNAIIAIGFKSISRYATDHKWGTVLTQKIIRILERRAIKSYFANSSIRQFIAKTTAGTAFMMGSFQMPMFNTEANKFIVKVEQLATTPATSKITEVATKSFSTIENTILNDVETQIQENTSAIFTSKIAMVETANAKIFSYIKGTNIIMMIKLEGQDILYKLIGNFDTNNGITLASAIASVTPKANSSNCTICTKQDQATCSKFESLQTKVGSHNGIAILCTGLTATNANPVITQLLTWDKAKIILFLDDIVANSNTCPVDKVDQYMKNNIPNITTNTLKAWNIYDQASRPCLRQSDGHLSKLAVAVSNTKLSNAPYNFNTQDFITIAIASGKQKEQIDKVDAELFPNLVSFSSKGYTVTNFERLKSNIKNTNSSFYVVAGANWTINYIATHSNEFANKTLNFEEEVEIDDEGSRVADLELIQAGKPTIYYEFKSVKEIKDSYITQFVKDLKRPDVNNLSQIQWVFDHDKMSVSQVKEKVIAALEKNKVMLDDILIINKFNQYAGSINYTKDIETVDVLIEFINKNDNWYNLIFK